MKKTTMRGLFLGLVGALVTSAALAKKDVPVEPALNETIVMVKNGRPFAVSLETTIFKPPGDGPFPVVVINHYKEFGHNQRRENYFQPRYRPLPPVRQFLQRGYAVVIPMRQGFSNSGGATVGAGCNTADNGRAQASDVKAVVNWLETQPWADRTRMVMLGRGQGGLTTMAYASDSPEPGFKLFVNFSGGLTYPDTPGCLGELALKSAFASYGKSTTVPSLWFYASNDSAYPPAVINPAYKAYVEAGGPARMVEIGAFEPDGVSLFNSYRGVDIWWPPVQERLAAQNMPTAVVFPQFASAGWIPAPPPSGYAKLNDTTKLPFGTSAMRKAYTIFLTKTGSRAFAVGTDGGWGYASNVEDPRKVALEFCQKKTAGACRLYAVDQDVVWTPDHGPAH